MKYATECPFAEPEKAARKLMEIASTVEPVQDGRIHIEDQRAIPFQRKHPAKTARGSFSALQRLSM